MLQETEYKYISCMFAMDPIAVYCDNEKTCSYQWHEIIVNISELEKDT